MKNITPLNEENITKILDFAYEKATSGFLGFDSAEELAQSYINQGKGKNEGKSKSETVNSLIRWQNSKSFTSGFITGIPGFALMPITLPANFTSVLIIQLRMIAAIAHIGGHDLKSDQVRTFVYICLTGNSANELLKKIGIEIGQKFTIAMIKNISGKTITEINKKIGFRLLTKFGEKGAINLGKAIPLIGGIIGGSFDTFTTNLIGNNARKIFIDNNVENQ